MGVPPNQPKLDYLVLNPWFELPHSKKFPYFFSDVVLLFLYIYLLNVLSVILSIPCGFIQCG